MLQMQENSQVLQRINRSACHSDDPVSFYIPLTDNWGHVICHVHLLVRSQRLLIRLLCSLIRFLRTARLARALASKCRANKKERASGAANGPIQTPQSQAVLDHCALHAVFDVYLAGLT